MLAMEDFYQHTVILVSDIFKSVSEIHLRICQHDHLVDYKYYACVSLTEIIQFKLQCCLWSCALMFWKQIRSFRFQDKVSVDCFETLNILGKHIEKQINHF